MISVRKRIQISLLFFVCTINIFACNFFEPNDVWPYYEAKVTAVVDGDTIKIRFTDSKPNGCRDTETIRLIGVDAPEISPPVEYYAKESKNFTNQLWSKQILIELDPDTNERDVYGRLLAYVYYNDANWNEALLQGGYAYYYGVFAFDSQRMQTFRFAETEAKRMKRGLWKEGDTR